MTAGAGGRLPALLVLLLLPAEGASARACRLDHAWYRENVSGAEIHFRPRNPASDGSLTVGLFELRLPHVAERFPGDIAWNAGGNTGPDGQVGRACAADEEADGGACRLWTGNAYSLGDAGAGLLGDAGMMAPRAILLADFGRVLAMTRAFAGANPGRAAFDVFTLAGCAP